MWLLSLEGQPAFAQASLHLPLLPFDALRVHNDLACVPSPKASLLVLLHTQSVLVLLHLIGADQAAEGDGLAGCGGPSGERKHVYCDPAGALDLYSTLAFFNRCLTGTSSVLIQQVI